MSDTESSNAKPPAQFSKGVELRAAIDLETVKSLLLLHGGGALAALTFLSTILNAKDGRYVPLAPYILEGVLIFTAGMFCVIKHNVHRRECSRLWELYWNDRGGRSNPGNSKPCIRSRRYLSTALWLFPVAIAYIAAWALWILATLPPVASR